MGTPIDEYRQKNKNDQEKMKELVKALVSSMFILQVALDGTHRDLSSSNLVVLDRREGQLVVAPIDWETFRPSNHAVIPFIDGMTTRSVMTPEEMFGSSAVPAVNQDSYAIGLQIVAILGGFPGDTYSFVRDGVAGSKNLKHLSQHIARKWLAPDGGKRWFHIEMACASRPVEEDKEKFAERLAEYAYAYCTLVLLNGIQTGGKCDLLKYIHKKWGFSKSELIVDDDEFDCHCEDYSLTDGEEMQPVRQACNELGGEKFFANLCSCLCVNSALRPMLEVLYDST